MPPNRLPINSFNPNTRPFSSDYISQPNPINPNVNFGNFGSLGPTGGFYPPPVYDPYGHYSMPPPPNYGYPPGPVFFLHFFSFLFLVTYILEATNVICYPIRSLFLSIFIKIIL